MRHISRGLSIGALLLVCGAGCMQKAVEQVAVQVKRIETGPLDLHALGDAPISIDQTIVQDDSPAQEDSRNSNKAVNGNQRRDASSIDLDPQNVSALQWLAEHQLPDGSWNFDHRTGPCGGRCDGAGTATGATNAATAMALLPFLSLGQSHQRGEYQQTVGRGVAYLVSKAKHDKNGTSFHERQGTMYSHGLATIVLCEAYGLTGDKQLKDVCQSALGFIDYAQDPVGGGWRYSPRQPGDTSVSGWHVSALKSGQLAGLTVPDKTLIGASRFFDSVQSDAGAKFGYTTPGARRSTTAIGLMSRIHLGGKRDHEAWQRGIDYIQKIGPSPSDLYFNFHATQAISQHGGEPWTKWQKSVGDLLHKTQAIDGHATGSWHTGNDHSTSRGGRLYCTSLATLILAIHHRKLGISQVEEDDR
ncbi:MAG: hypothetical protein QF918_05900 [Pirellulaceae bacterium]|nr:hypothetical protein [Pirellulaceae bacterium]